MTTRSMAASLLTNGGQKLRGNRQASEPPSLRRVHDGRAEQLTSFDFFQRLETDPGSFGVGLGFLLLVLGLFFEQFALLLLEFEPSACLVFLNGALVLGGLEAAATSATG